MIAIRNSTIAFRCKIQPNIASRYSKQGQYCIVNTNTTTKKNSLNNHTKIRVKSTTVEEATATAGTGTTESTTPIGKTCVAMVAGITAVAGVAFVSEELTSRYYPMPKFDPTKQQFDQSTFAGRFFRMIAACDPRLLFYSNAHIRDMEAIVKNYDKYDDDALLWKAHRMTSAAINPETGNFLPRPFRMSGYVPYNGPICVAMVASTSTPALLFWGWVNQSQNALINYFNATGSMSNETLAKSYSLAVISALSVVFGLTSIIQKRYSPEKARQLLRFIAFPSCIVASSLNCYFVRSPEIQTGIALFDSNGQTVLPGETSQIAAKGGVYSTTASRAMLQAPVFFVPPFLLTLPYFKSLLLKNPTLSVPLSTFLLLVSFGVGLPATVAIFPQIVQINVEELEEKYRNLQDKDGSHISKLYYNKGL